MRPSFLAIVMVVLAAGVCHGAETLSEAWQVAVRQNQGLLASQLQTSAAWHDVRAATSEYAPSASVRTGYLVRTAQPSFSSSQPGFGVSRFPFAQRNAASFSARASQPLWTAGRIDSSVASAHSRYEASEAARNWIEMDLRMAVAEAYLAILEAQASLAAAEQLLLSDQAEYSDVMHRAAQRRATDDEVLASRVAATEAEQRVRTAGNHLVNAYSGYNRLLGRPVEAMPEIVQPVLPLLGESLDELTQVAIATRPDLQEIREKIEVHEHNAKGWRASTKPQMSAEAGFDFEENEFQSPQGVGTVGVYLDWNVFDAGKLKRKSTAADERAAAMRAALRDKQAQIALEVSHAWNHRSDALGAERVAADRLGYAQQHDRSVGQLSTHGAVVAASAVASQAAVVDAKTRYLHAQTGRVLSQIRLRFVAGLLDMD